MDFFPEEINIIILEYLKFNQLFEKRKINKKFKYCCDKIIFKICDKYHLALYYWKYIYENQQNIFNKKTFNKIEQHNNMVFKNFHKFFELDFFSNNLIILFYFFNLYPIPILKLTSYDEFIDNYNLINSEKICNKHIPIAFVNKYGFSDNMIINYSIPDRNLSWNLTDDNFFWFFVEENDCISNYYLYYKNEEITKKKWGRSGNINKLISDIDKYGRNLNFSEFIYIEVNYNQIAKAYGFETRKEKITFFGNDTSPIINNNFYFYNKETDSIDITKKEYDFKYKILFDILKIDFFFKNGIL